MLLATFLRRARMQRIYISRECASFGAFWYRECGAISYETRKADTMIRRREENWKRWQKILIQTILILSAFPANWSCIAILAIHAMYRERGNLERQILKMSGWVILYGIVSFFFVSRIYAIELIGVLMVYPVLKLYNGERGKAKWMKWFFYVYYPLHLIIIGIIRLIVYGNVNICL